MKQYEKSLIVGFLSLVAGIIAPNEWIKATGYLSAGGLFVFALHEYYEK